MTQRDDGGPAFPREYNMTGVPGMSLRDWFAGQALAGLLGNPGGPVQANSLCGWGLTNCEPEHVADECYAFADAMLAVRGEPPA